MSIDRIFIGDIVESMGEYKGHVISQKIKVNAILYKITDKIFIDIKEMKIYKKVPRVEWKDGNIYINKLTKYEVLYDQKTKTNIPRNRLLKSVK